ncbi:HEAT repeat domain-containing protein [Thermogemmata fonticola]|uniref:HEAT repeat domain-containing protein n=1 Tax=Thermogemmata fonticola TaxID=2755323 RepID=A0A7V9ABZ8_9BACT|nr:HEAT repeat domain-containing protein [Thermogemmata fonticola]MBA2226538.1 HEAT repeat domain-containing protein [Thermogemmata fonticola]
MSGLGSRRWKYGGILAGGFLFGVILAVVLAQRQHLQAWYAAHQLRTATELSQKVRAAERLMELQEIGQRRVLNILIAGDETSRQAVLHAWQCRVEEWPEEVIQKWLDAAATVWDEADEQGQKALLEMARPVLGRPGWAEVPACRRIVCCGLSSRHASVRRDAVGMARHYGSQLRQQWLELLKDSEAEVRRAALFTVAAFGDSSVWLADEELFHWLHDPDEGVRRICHDALLSRGRTVLEIDLGRRLTHPDAQERLKLIAELRYDDGVADPEPWLHYLVRDPEAAVRVAAVRAVAELRLQRRSLCPPWVESVVRTDPDALARRIMQYYQELPLQMRNGEVRPAGGPP